MVNDSLVSAIIPVYNCERYLSQALDSVIEQTYDSVEIIVIDDGSTDGSEAVARRCGVDVQYHRQPHSGPGAARNHGASLAQGALLAFLDADDVWTEDKLAHQKTVLDSNPDLDIVFGLVEQFHSPELDAAIREKTECPPGSMPGYHPGTMLIRREAFFKAGVFETSWQVGEFIDWYVRAAEKGLKSQMLQEVVMRRRIHGNNLVIREKQAQTDYVRILKASLDRRRQASRK